MHSLENMGYLFHNCLSLESIELTNINTENVYNMRNMFTNCAKLTNLNLNQFKFGKVEYMNEMLLNPDLYGLEEEQEKDNDNL